MAETGDVLSYGRKDGKIIVRDDATGKSTILDTNYQKKVDDLLKEQSKDDKSQ